MSFSKTNTWILIIILAGSAILRLYNYSDFSITADEVSAINRAQFNSFSELIDKGVCKDTHPAGVQVFLHYWIKVFGISEASVRFPFVLAGIFAVLFVFLIAARWFGEMTGLLAAAAIGFLEFPITYSQLARMYAPGFLFSLIAVWCWTKFLFDKQHNKPVVFWGYIVASVLCCYIHYFSALFVVIVGITGLFFLNKDNFKKYFLAGGCMVLLYLPHFKIFLLQFSKGGIGGKDGWLSAPKPDFIWKYISYGLNDSWIIAILFILFLLGGIILNFRSLHWKKFHSLCLAWFFLPYIIGYYYSIHVNPLLQYSILLFSFPFLIMFLLSFIKIPEKKVWQYGLPFLFFTTGTYSTVKEKDFYTTPHFGVLKEIAQSTMKYDELFGEKNVTKTINLVGPYSIHYYFNKYDKNPRFETYMNNGHEELYEFSRIIDSAMTPYFLFAWSTRYSPSEIPEMIQEKYPIVIEKQYYFNSEFYLFGKEGKSIPEEIVFNSLNTFEQKVPLWSDNEQALQDSMYLHGKKAIKLEGANEYSHTFRAKIKDVIKSSGDIVNVSLMGMLGSEDADALVVISFESHDSSYSWHSNSFKFFVKQPHVWEKIYLSERLPENISKEDNLVVYVWNNSKKTIFIDDMQVKVTKGNSLAYGKRKELE